MKTRLQGMMIAIPLLLEISENRIDILKSYAKKMNIVCVLKDARTLVANYQNNTYLNTTGNASMAKGGSGDVLTGMIAGILAQGSELFEAATLGVYLHGLSGDYAKESSGKYSVFASDIIDSISNVLKEI